MPPTLVYFHGFLSSPESYKAKLVGEYLLTHHPEWTFLCPFLSSLPTVAVEQIDRIIESPANPVYCIGSSLGGYWATYFSEQRKCPAVLVNPAVRPYQRFAGLVGSELKNYHTDDHYLLQQADLEVLEQVHTATLSNPNSIWLLAQKGDDVLDYREAQQYYQGCKQSVEEGGSHEFDDFERWLPQLISFFESHPDTSEFKPIS